MKRLLPLLCALLLLAALPAGASARSAYCSSSGDVCYSVKKARGDALLRFGTFSFSGRIDICVTAPDRSRRCKTFRLKLDRAGIYMVRVRWSKHFPRRGRGVYRVRFRRGGANLGPRVGFRR